MIEDKKVFRVLWWMAAVVKVVSAGVSCLSNPCYHGICIDDVNSTYSCYCVDGYTGVQCQTNWDECWSNPCLNGGSCVDGIATYNCSCPDGFIGENCETNYNECESNPCLNNGTCIDMTNGYMCSCVPGFSGEHCEMDIAMCNNTEEVRCYNGGQCIEGPGYKFYCKCMPGWTGKKCEDQIDECESNPCQNGGVCIDAHADYMCACAFGYTGKSCEVQIEFCDNNSCSNNALCVVEEGARVCYCVPDYHGERCELQYDECLLGPRCMNGGSCIDGVDNFTCSCPPKLTGPLCECLILDDDTFDCEYVSPTPGSTQSVFTNTMFNESTPSFTSSSSFISTAEVTTEAESAMPTNEVTMTSPTETITERTETIDTTDPVTDGTQVSTKPDGTIELTDSTTTVVPQTETESTVESRTNPPTPEITTETPTTVTETTIVEIPEVTIPPIDATSQIFTDTPTDYLPELVTPTSGTTETIDISTATDSIHTGTTVLSECTDSLCNNHGTCVNSPHGVRCHCMFNYAGRFCEEKIIIKSAAFGGNSFVSHRLENTTSIDIAFNAKTLLSDGQIMHVDIATGVYMQLFMNSGLLKFKFSCGYQTMLLSELKTYVNKGFAMKIETRLDLFPKERHCNATLRLNDTVAMSGGQIANISILDHNTTLYLGNSPDIDDDELKPFVGCIKDLTVNDIERDVFGEAFDASGVQECLSLACLSSPCHNGGTCTERNGSYTCSCANGWTGEHCEKSVCEHNPCQFGGSCIRHPGSGFLCLCPYGKHGIFCEYNVEITKPSLAPISAGISSYIVYPLTPSAANSDRFDLRLRFQTSDMDQISLLAFVGQTGKHDARSQHLALTFVKGYIMLTWNLGSGPRRVFTSRAAGTRRGGHSVRVWRRGRSAGLSLDGRHNASGNAPAHTTDRMTLAPYLYIGGHPSFSFSELPHDLPLHGGWRGCVWDAGARGAAGRGVGQCHVSHCSARACRAPRGLCIHAPATYGCICNEGWYGPTCSHSENPCDFSVTKCRGQCVVQADGSTQCDCAYGKTGINCDQDLYPTDVLFSGTRSFVRLHPRIVSSVSLALEAEIKPNKERGLITFVETPHFYTSLSLQGGLLEYRWTDRVSGVTSLVRSGAVVSVSQWHGVKAGRYGSRLYVWLDDQLATDAMLAHAYPHTDSNATVLLGGAPDLSKLPFDATSGPPESFAGCIRNLHLNNVLIPLEKQNILDGQNVDDCDGTACGSEVCGAGACELRGGVAACTCGAGAAGGAGAGVGAAASAGAGARCRRDAGCSAASCRRPGGACRAGRCVCAAGHAGDYCDINVNISIPQLSGDSLISLSRGIESRRTGEQRIFHTPEHLSLNFTTATPAGLLLWANMDADYLGIGLEEGYLRLVWSFRNTTTTHTSKTPKAVSRLIPNAGFLADGEWHIIVLKMGRNNISIVVDGLAEFFEEPGVTSLADYTDAELYIGGTVEENVIAKDIFPHKFKGCIDHISTKENTYFTNYNEVYSENVKSCQLFPPT